ncbi:MAG: penicillin-binding transpeptidase domain-containing protein, partial [Chloroflexota bacterium]
LTLGESALLAGLPQAPASLDPLNPDPEIQQAVLQRWRIVLNALVNEGYITSAQRDETLRQGLEVFTPEAPLRAPHFTVFAQGELEDVLTESGINPESIAAGGYEVFTTVDLGLNNQVEAAIVTQVGQLAANNVSNGAVVVLKPLTGEIVAMLGSADYDNEAIDGRVNVAVSPRQPGSTVKSFTYAAAMENGMSPADVIWDTQVRSISVPGQATWPVNYDRTYHGPVNMRAALANSYNVPAVKVLERAVGTEGLLNYMRRFGMTSLNPDPSLYGPSLTLGGGEVTLLELSRAYGVFANQGVLVPTTAILCVLDSEDNIIYQFEGGCPEGNVTPETVARTALGTQVLDPRISFIVTDILADNNARAPAMGANSPLRTDGIASSVKTGTTNDVKDNWTVGYTRNVVVGVWVGNSNGDPMVNSSGLTGAAPIWNSVINTVYNNNRYFNVLAVDGTHQPDQPNPPQSMSLRQVCDVRNLRDGSEQCSTINEWELDGPAGVPTSDGQFVYRDPEPQQQSQPQPGQPFQQEISPGVIRVRAHPIPQSVAASLQLSSDPSIGVPPAPRYCQVPSDLVSHAPASRDLLFLKPPPQPADAIEAEKYAIGRGLAYLPTIACSPELLQAQGSGPTVITAVINQPQQGQVISEGIPIIGTVQFSPEQADYYKLEILGGQFGGWTTIGTTHNQNVVNGQLEFLPGSPGLQPGDYQLRLAVVANGNYIQEPYTVGFSVR